MVSAVGSTGVPGVVVRDGESAVVTVTAATATRTPQVVSRTASSPSIEASAPAVTSLAIVNAVAGSPVVTTTAPAATVETTGDITAIASAAVVTTTNPNAERVTGSVSSTADAATVTVSVASALAEDVAPEPEPVVIPHSPGFRRRRYKGRGQRFPLHEITAHVFVTPTLELLGVRYGLVNAGAVLSVDVEIADALVSERRVYPVQRIGVQINVSVYVRYRRVAPAMRYGLILAGPSIGVAFSGESNRISTRDDDVFELELLGALETENLYD